MKKTLFIAILLLPLTVLATNIEDEQGGSGGEESSGAFPVVSIGVGNGNTPENLGPVHNSVFHGDIPVYVTVTDDNIESYHFRVVKDGGLDGHTCTEELALFAEENQGHASTTLSKETCGFSFNKALFITEGISNFFLTMVNTIDLGMFSGEGDYWFILGAKDMDQNRTHLNHLLDPRVKITVDNTAPNTIGSVLVPGLEGPFTVDTTSTDLHGISTTTIYSAISDGLNCQTFNPITSITGNLTNISTSSTQWTPEVSGTYCVGASSIDLPGNIEPIKIIATEIHFTAPFVPPTPTSTPTTTPSTVGSGSTGGGGGGGGGGNGPIVNTFGVSGGGPITNPTIPNQNGGSGSGQSFAGGIGGDGTTLDTDNLSDSSQSSGQSQGIVGGSSSNLTGDNGSFANIAFASESLETSTSTDEIGTSEDQLAQVGSSGINLNWLWLLILAILIGTGYYIYQKD